MNRFETLSGEAIPFGLKNVDTDVILPAKHLKVITRSGLGRFEFALCARANLTMYSTPTRKRPF